MKNIKQNQNNKQKTRLVGVVAYRGKNPILKPCDRKIADNLYNLLPASSTQPYKEGDVVVVQINSNEDKSLATVKRILGNKKAPGILSLISICEKGLSENFSQAAINCTIGATVPSLGNREDLRNIPLVTIDGEDARDFDDAVFAEPTKDGGFHLVVAIADVSWYVRPGTALDREAYLRGNSTYFSDKVVPMLPEALSNELCSLKPNVERACLAFHLWIDKDGNLKQQRITRGLMKSVARLTYNQVQAAKDGNPDTEIAPLMDNVINPLYAAYNVLRAAREKRGAMDMDAAEVKAAVDSTTGQVTGINKRTRIDSHRLIEEFMVLANVAAGTTLKEKGANFPSRIHAAPPSEEKVDLLREYLETLNIALPTSVEQASVFNDILKKTAGTPQGQAIEQAILQIQAKAAYATENIGHYGLALLIYAHFTSPIRRYADLLVHRALVDAYNLGEGGLNDYQQSHLDDMCLHISGTERISDQAERNATARMMADFLSHHAPDTVFSGHISGTSKGGVYIQLDDTGATGFLPLSSLPRDFYEFNETHRMVRGRNTGNNYRAGDAISVKINAANAMTGELTFTPAADAASAVPKAIKPPRLGG